MVSDRAFRQHLLSGYHIGLPLMEAARLRLLILQQERAAFRGAVRRYQARYNLEQRALAALKIRE